MIIVVYLPAMIRLTEFKEVVRYCFDFERFDVDELQIHVQKSWHIPVLVAVLYLIAAYSAQKLVKVSLQ